MRVAYHTIPHRHSDERNVIASHVPTRVTAQYCQCARGFSGFVGGVARRAGPRRATLNSAGALTKSRMARIHGSARCGHRAPDSARCTRVPSRDTADTQRNARRRLRIERRAGTHPHVRAQPRSGQRRRKPVERQSLVRVLDGYGRGAWHMRCAYQGVVAVVPWRVAAFETRSACQSRRRA